MKTSTERGTYFRSSETTVFEKFVKIYIGGIQTTVGKSSGNLGTVEGTERFDLIFSSYLGKLGI